MYSIIFADIILIIHFSIVCFIVSLFTTIPLGYKFKWSWVRNRNLRTLHILLIILVTVETIVGIHCPLTLIENSLRGVYVSNSFINIWLKKIMFWNLPNLFFLILYTFCSLYTILLWIKFPPDEIK